MRAQATPVMRGRILRHVAGAMDGRGGAVAIVQRVGGAMNLNVHVHALIIDGVFARPGPDVRFCGAPLLTASDNGGSLACRAEGEWRPL